MGLKALLKFQIIAIHLSLIPMEKYSGTLMGEMSVLQYRYRTRIFTTRNEDWAQS